MPDRDHNGHFAPGNNVQKANWVQRRTDQLQRLKDVILETAPPADVARVIRGLYSLSTDENLPAETRIKASREYLDRVCGKPVQEVSMDKRLNVQKQVIQLDFSKLSDKELHQLLGRSDREVLDSTTATPLITQEEIVPSVN